MTDKRRPFLLMALMFAASGAALALHPTHRIADEAPMIDLQAIVPQRFGEWRVNESIVPIKPTPELQAVIDATYDQTLGKTYVNSTGEYIMLSIAYGGNQRAEMNTHRPEVCYPAQGFTLDSSRSDHLPVLGRDLPLKRVLTHLGTRIEPITYWVVVGDELTKFGIAHRLSTLKYNLTGRIPDGMLIRVSSIDPDQQRAFALQDRFIREMLAAIPLKDQARFLGVLPN